MRRLIFFCALALSSALSLQAADLAAPMKTVEAVRERKFAHDVDRRTMKRSELRQYILEQISHSVKSADDYRVILETMQLVDHDPKLIDRLLELYEAQVLAFYDPEKHAYFSLDEMPAGIAPNAVIDDVVAVHELTHALQDQLFDAGRRIDSVQDDWDREIAYHSVLEGEATLVMIGGLYRNLGQSLDALTKDDSVIDAMMKAADVAGGIPANTPPFLVESMKFPYLDGLRFVIAAYRRGGWDAVDALHTNPPISSEEILHPEIYFARRAAKTDVASLDRSAYFSTHLGEFFWRELVGAESSKGADRSTFTIRRDRKNRLTSFVEATWDSDDDAEHFASAYERFLFSRDIHPQISRQGRVVRVAYGADTRAAKKFVRSMRNAQ